MRTEDLAHLPEPEIVRRLAIARHRPLDNPYPPGFLEGEPQLAAVLIPFLMIASRWHLLLIRRTVNATDRHGGQVAYPGGRSDPSDGDQETTALREAEEEIGVNPADVRIFGRLNDFLTITNYLVTPVIGVIPWPYKLQLAPSEVDRAFSVPLDWLARPENYELRTHNLPGRQEPMEVIYFRAYEGEVLWGASARITLNLLQALID